MALESGHKAIPLEGEELSRQDENFVGFNHGICRFVPGGWFLPSAYAQFADKIFNFEWKASDVLVMGYPRSGTSWLLEIIWNMRNNPDLDSPLRHLPILGRTPYLDLDMMMDGKRMPPITPDNPMVKTFLELCPGANPSEGVCWQMAAATPDPRTMKCHLPFSLLHPHLLDKTKVVYIARNCRDVLVSIHHHCRLLSTLNFKGGLEDFFTYFLNDEVAYGPYWLHIKEAWEKKDNKNLHFVFYENLKSDARGEIAKLNDFLETGLTGDQLDKVVNYTSFAEMQARDNVLGTKSIDNPMMNSEVVQESGGFFRKGEVGDWKEKLSTQMIGKLDSWIEGQLSEVPFKYSI